MNRLLVLITIVCTGFVPVVAGRTPEPLGSVDVKLDTLEVQGDSVFLSMQIRVEGCILSGNRSLTLTPVLIDSDNECELMPVLLNSRRQQRIFHRSDVLQPEKEWPYYQVLGIRKGTADTINYRIKLLREDWMTRAGVFLRERDFRCLDCYSTMEVEYSHWPYSPVYGADRMLTLQNYVIPPPEGVKHRVALGHAYLHFRVNETLIDLDYRKNRQEMKRIYESISSIQNNPDVRMSGIQIQGYASPEGSPEVNARLSLKRAFSLKDNIQYFFMLDSTLLQVESKRERDGLMALLQNRQNVESDSVFAQINEPSLQENIVAQLSSGASYDSLKKAFYPDLRKVEYNVSYVVRAYTLEELDERFRTAPQNLSQNELFMLAESYGRNSPAFDAVIEKIQELNPNDTTANINAAAVFLRHGETEMAGLCLKKCTDCPSAFNNLGAYFIQVGELLQAEQYLVKAAADNIPEADRNLLILRARMRIGQKNETHPL